MTNRSNNSLGALTLDEFMRSNIQRSIWNIIENVTAAYNIACLFDEIKNLNLPRQKKRKRPTMILFYFFPYVFFTESWPVQSGHVWFT